MSKVYRTSQNLTYGTDEWFTACRQIDKRVDQRYVASVRAKKYGVKNTLTLQEWTAMLEVSKGHCFYCEKDVGAENLGIDHFIPFFANGENTLENVVPSCFTCNAKKGRKVLTK